MAKTIKVTLKGISPLLMHAFPMTPVEALEKKSPEEQAELATYRDPVSHKLYIPAANVTRSLVSAASYSKGKGRSNLVRQSAACIQVSPERLILDVQKYVVDSRPVVIAATKGRVIRHRPRFDQWQISFELEYDETLLKETELRKIVDDMGARVGLLDFRPEKKGSFGRCAVVAWH